MNKSDTQNGTTGTMSPHSGTMAPK
jgi:hypothetical protein